MKLKMPRMGGLPLPEASLPKVPGAPAKPKVSGSPMKVGEQATVKMPKSKKMADATDKPSVFFKTESSDKKPSVGNLRAFIENSKQRQQSSESNERLSMDHDKKISARDAAIAVLAKASEILNASKLAKSEAPQWKPREESSPHVSSHEHDDRAGSGRHHLVSTSDGSNWNFSVADHKTGQQSGWQKGGSLEEAKSKALSHKMAPKMAKSEQSVTPPDGTQTQREPPSNYNGNPAPGADPVNLGKPYKGHIKLAKFMGRMEAKREAKKAAPASAPAPLDKGEISEATNPKSKLKGIHQSPDWQPEKGKSHAGTSVRSSVGNGRHGAIGQGEIAEAKDAHKEVLGEMKSMPKPKLPG